jgi:PilZ domain
MAPASVQAYLRRCQTGLGMAATGQTRRHPRVKAPAGMLVGWQVGTQRYVSRLENIALGGLFIRTPNPPPADSLVKVIVSLPLGTGEVQARGVVRRVAPSRGMGVEFTAMNPEDRGRLTGLLKPLLEQQTNTPDRPV